MKRAIAREREAWAEQMQEQTRMKSTLVIAAAIIAAVRLARDPDISRPSSRLVCLDTAAIRYVHSTTPVFEWLSQTVWRKEPSRSIH